MIEKILQQYSNNRHHAYIPISGIDGIPGYLQRNGSVYRVANILFKVEEVKGIYLDNCGNLTIYLKEESDFR